MALENIGSAENLGVIARNCAACGVDAIIKGPGCADPYLRRAVRNSMGTVFRLPVVHTQDLRDALAALRPKNPMFLSAGDDYRFLKTTRQPGAFLLQIVVMQLN